MTGGPHPWDPERSRLATELAEGTSEIADDLARFRAVFDRYRPDLIIDTGAGAGTRALWMATTAGCRVLACDTTLDQVAPATRQAMLVSDVLLVPGESLEQRVSLLLRAELAMAARPMLVLGQYAVGEQAHAEMAAFASALPIGGWMVVRNTLGPVGELWGDQAATPAHAVGWWLNQGFDWVIDTDIAGLSPVSRHPGAWLRRVS